MRREVVEAQRKLVERSQAFIKLSSSFHQAFIKHSVKKPSHVKLLWFIPVLFNSLQHYSELCVMLNVLPVLITEVGVQIGLVDFLIQAFALGTMGVHPLNFQFVEIGLNLSNAVTQLPELVELSLILGTNVLVVLRRCNWFVLITSRQPSETDVISRCASVSVRVSAHVCSKRVGSISATNHRVPSVGPVAPSDWGFP